MTFPWEDALYFATVADAEASITSAGYVRDPQRHVWVHPGTRKAVKVARAADSRFFVERA